MIGWVYESDREKIKEANQDLEDFYDQDRIDDLEATRDKELELLQDRIEAWDLYLKALEWKYEEFDRIERDKLLKELLNAETEEEIREKITTDMLEFNETCDGSYKEYIGIFTNFLNSYEENLNRLQELYEKQLSILQAASNLKFNNQMTVEGILNETIVVGGGQTSGGSTAWIPGTGMVPVNIENGHTTTSGLPVGTIVYPSGGGAWEITGVNEDGSYQSKPVSSSSSGGSSSGGSSSSVSGSSSSSSSTGKVWQVAAGGNAPEGAGIGDVVQTAGGDYQIVEANTPGSHYNPSSGHWSIKVDGYSDGLDNGPVTYTGLAMLHGSAGSPEYVLNNDQAYNLLSYLANKPLDYEKVVDKSEGINYIIQGDVILEDVENPADFWNEVTKAMGNRWSVIKNK